MIGSERGGWPAETLVITCWTILPKQLHDSSFCLYLRAQREIAAHEWFWALREVRAGTARAHRFDDTNETLGTTGHATSATNRRLRCFPVGRLADGRCGNR